MRPEPQAGILDIAAYVPGKSKGPRNVTVHKLSSNETPLGTPRAAVEAFHAAAATLELYPDGAAGDLRAALGARFGLNPDNIVCGAGSDELIGLVSKAYLGPGTEGLYSRHGFLMYEICIRANGATPVVAEETALTADVDSLLAKVSERTRVVYLANPNNPTGTYIAIDEVRRLHAGLPPGVLLVLDAAYAEYVRRNDYEAGVELVSTSANVVMMRTFSKIFGLAALRLGWMYAPAHVCDVVNRIRGPFNVSAPALAAGAAAVADQAYVDRAVEHNARWIEWLGAELTELGLDVTPSVGNFILIGFPEACGASAREADAFLTERGFILRRLENYHLAHCLRMTIGTEEANRGVVAALAELLGRR